DRKMADDAIRDVVACAAFAIVIEVGSKGRVDEGANLRGSVVAIVEFLNGHDVGLESLKDANGKGLNLLGVPVEVRRHHADDGIRRSQNGPWCRLHMENERTQHRAKE